MKDLKRIPVRVTEEEWNQIKKRMEETGVRYASAFFRRMALKGYIVNLDMSDFKEVSRLLSINSNNLNQYAKRANETGSIYLSDIRELQKSQAELIKLLGEISDHLAQIVAVT